MRRPGGQASRFGAAPSAREGQLHAPRAAEHSFRRFGSVRYRAAWPPEHTLLHWGLLTPVVTPFARRRRTATVGRCRIARATVPDRLSDGYVDGASNIGIGSTHSRSAGSPTEQRMPPHGRQAHGARRSTHAATLNARRVARPPPMPHQLGKAVSWLVADGRQDTPEAFSRSSALALRRCRPSGPGSAAIASSARVTTRGHDLARLPGTRLNPHKESASAASQRGRTDCTEESARLQGTGRARTAGRVPCRCARGGIISLAKRATPSSCTHRPTPLASARWAGDVRNSHLSPGPIGRQKSSRGHVPAASAPTLIHPRRFEHRAPACAHTHAPWAAVRALLLDAPTRPQQQKLR
eukprot:353088-Chlamydomonas_euryale.AAC.10